MSAIGQLCQPALEQSPLWALWDELERAAVRLTRLVEPADAPKQVGPCDVEIAVAVEGEPVERGEPGRRRAGLGDGDGPVQLDDGRPGQARELAVQRCYLRTVARLVGMKRGDRRLNDVR